MKEFIDNTSTQKGTMLSRSSFMAMQGFVEQTTTFNSDGSITETNKYGETLTTTFNADGSITEIFVGKKGIRKITTFNSDGSIKVEVLNI